MLRVLAKARPRPIESVLSSAFFKPNVILAVLVLITLASYIFLSNLLVSQRYVLNLRKQRLNQLITRLPNNTMDSSAYDMKDLLLFAQASGMVEVKDAGVILEETGVAVSETVSGRQSR